MSRADEAGQTRPPIDIHRDHQIETQEREVGEVVLRQLFAAQVRVDAAQSAKAVFGDACSFQVGEFNAPRIADDNVFDVAFAVNQDADLPSCFVREFGELARKFWRNDLLWRDAPRVEFFDAAELVRFKTLCVAVYGTDVVNPPYVLYVRHALRRASATPALAVSAL
jgi:hypothetical protein